MFESSQAPWSLEELGYAYDAPHFHTDGRIEGGLYPPEYYAYSPHAGSWQDGLQDIEDFDWPSEKYDHCLYETQESSVQRPGEVLALKSAVSPLATTSDESSVPTDKILDQAKPYQSEVNLGDHVQDLYWLSLATANTSVSDTSIPAALSLPPTSPPWVPDPSPGQVPKNSVAPLHTSLDAQTDVVEFKEQSNRVSDGMDVDCPFSVTGLDGLRTSLVDKYDAAKQQVAERDSEAPFLRDENSINAEATSGNDATCYGDGTNGVEIPASSTLPTTETSSVSPSPDIKLGQLVQEPSEFELINCNPMPLDVPCCTRIAEDFVSTGGRLEELSRFQTKDNREERMPEQAEPVRRDLDSSKESSMNVGYGSPAQQRPAWPEQWLEQQCASSMALPPLPFQPEEDRNDQLGSETSSLSDAPSFETHATLEYTPDGLARNLTTVIQAEGANTDGSTTKGQEMAVAPANAEAPAKTLGLEVSRRDLSKRSQPAQETNGTWDTDPDAPPKKRQRQGALGTRMKSTKALGESPAVTRNEDTLVLAEDAGTAARTRKPCTPPKAKPRCVAAQAKSEAVIKAQQRAARKAPTSRATRNKISTAVAVAEEEEGEEGPKPLSPPKTRATKGTYEKQPTAPLSIMSESGTPGTNKYGFKPPRGSKTLPPRNRATAAGTRAPSALRPTPRQR